MKYLSALQIKTLDYEIDMIKHNLQRICITNNRKELDDMYRYAKERIDRIYVLNQQRFEEEVNEGNTID